MTRPEDWIETALGRDDLDPDEQHAADEILARHPEAHVLLDRIRRIEAGDEAPRGALPPLDSAEMSRPRDAWEAADQSLTSLRERLRLPARGLRRSEAQPAPRDPARSIFGWYRGKLRIRGAIFLPAAAVAATALFILFRLGPGAADRESPAPLGFGRSIEAGALTVEPTERFRGGDPDTLQPPSPSAAPEARIWRTGDAFVLRCPVDEPALAVLFHVDPVGRIELLHPESAAGPFLPASSGGSLELPIPGSGIEWFLEGRPGTETFLLALAEEGRDLTDALTTVVGEAGKLGNDDADHGEVVGRLRELMERSFGTVSITRIQHVD